MIKNRKFITFFLDLINPNFVFNIEYSTKKLPENIINILNKNETNLQNQNLQQK